MLKPNVLTHDIAAGLNAGGAQAEAAKAKLRAAIVACDGWPRKMALQLDVSRATLHRWLKRDDLVDLRELAAKLRAKSGQLEARLEKARAARGKRKD